MTMTYAGSGVVYEDMDPFKVACQKRAALTSKNAQRFGLVSVEWTRGESVHLMYEQQSSSGVHRYRGHVEEGLGTKIKVTESMYSLTQIPRFGAAAKDTVAMIVNDMITLGIFPTTVEMHLAVGSSSWFNDEARTIDLINGWGNACDLARCVWAGGETPTLAGLPYPVLAGSAAGQSKHDGLHESLINPENLRAGDLIVLIGSSGIHANGLTLARKIAEKLSPNPERPDLGYLRPLSDGRTYGESLLEPTHIYVPLVEDCFDEGVDFHYLINITGHGYRKLMRARQSFTYVLEELMPVHPVFDFIAEHGPVDEQEMFGNLNMGAGFAAYVAPRDAQKVVDVATRIGLPAKIAGHIEEGPKKVVIKPRSLEYSAETLAVR